jgi:hypothetical protein
MAEKDIKHKLPAPTVCNNCGSKVDYVNNEAIYGRSYGKWPYAYRCSSFTCDSYVGVHPNTKIPLGTLADRATREARKQYKPMFFDLLAQKGWHRGKGYNWLSKAMSIPPEETHWGMFNVERCKLAGELCLKEMAALK